MVGQDIESMVVAMDKDLNVESVKELFSRAQRVAHTAQ
jgi:hypothetical protein